MLSYPPSFFLCVCVARPLLSRKEDGPRPGLRSPTPTPPPSPPSSGLDIPDVDLVVHYELPQDPEAFLHRSGEPGGWWWWLGGGGSAALAARVGTLGRAPERPAGAHTPQPLLAHLRPALFDPSVRIAESPATVTHEIVPARATWGGAVLGGRLPHSSELRPVAPGVPLSVRWAAEGRCAKLRGAHMTTAGEREPPDMQCTSALPPATRTLSGWVGGARGARRSAARQLPCPASNQTGGEGQQLLETTSARGAGRGPGAAP